jgi:hypothetical protein
LYERISVHRLPWSLSDGGAISGTDCTCFKRIDICNFLQYFCYTSIILRVHHSFIHLAVCRTTGPKPLPKRALHIVGSRTSSFQRECPILSWRSSSSFLRFLPRLPVTSIPPFIFPAMTCCRR